MKKVLDYLEELEDLAFGTKAQEQVYKIIDKIRKLIEEE